MRDFSFRQEIEELGLIRNPKFKVSRRGRSIYILIPCSRAGERASYKVSCIVSLGDVSISVREPRTYPVVHEWIEGIKISSFLNSAGVNVKDINTCTSTTAAYALLHNI